MARDLNRDELMQEARNKQTRYEETKNAVFNLASSSFQAFNNYANPQSKPQGGMPYGGQQQNGMPYGGQSQGGMPYGGQSQNNPFTQGPFNPGYINQGQNNYNPQASHPFNPQGGQQNGQQYPQFPTFPGMQAPYPGANSPFGGYPGQNNGGNNQYRGY